MAVLPRWGRVVASAGAVPWVLVDPSGQPVRPVYVYLLDFVVADARPSSVRSYAYDLLRWWRWLQVDSTVWDRATSDEVKRFVLWFRRTVKVRQHARTGSLMTTGTVNPTTRKQYLDDRYAARTIRHSNAVLRSFYDFWIDRGEGPLLNPVALDPWPGRPGSGEWSRGAERLRSGARIRYNPRLPKRRPRAMPDPQWNAVFAALRSDRDRALVSVAVSSACRPSELLGVRGVDVEWGEQLIRVVRKGTGALQWLPVSAEALVWLRLSLAELGGVDVNQSVWWTLRSRDHGDGLRRQPLNYEALRAVFRRVNASLGTNWTWHDLRHTASVRMSQDRRLSLRDVQTILGHAHASTTAEVYMVVDEAEVIGRVAEHLAEGPRPATTVPATLVDRYAAEDLAVLFGSSDL